MHRMWVPLWRKSQDSTLFQDDHLWKMWTWFLMKMAHENTTVMMKTGRGTTPVDLTPGQLVVGRTSGAKALGWTGSNYRNRLKKLKTMKKVTIQPDTHWSIITVMNWDAYKVGGNKKDSREDTQEDRQRTGKGQASGHKEEVKEFKELKEEYNGSFSEEFWETWGEWEQFRKEKKKTLTPTTVSRQLKKLSKLSLPHAIETLERSITNGWTGLFPDKERSKQVTLAYKGPDQPLEENIEPED